MRTLLTPFGTWLTHKLAIICLLLMALTTSTLAQAAAPVITSPAPGSTLPTVAVGGSVNITITSSGGVLPIDGWYECDIDNWDGNPCLPPGLTLDNSPGSATTSLHGSPTTAGTYHFAVSVLGNDSLAGVAFYDLVVTGASAPTVGPVSATVAANSSNNPIFLNISGAAATSVAVASAASHGTATASGTSITYTPTAGYSGTDSFTYTATNSIDKTAK